MKTLRRTLLSIVVAFSVIGCSTFSVDDRPPLMDDGEFTDFIPTIVTNYMIINTNTSLITNNVNFVTNSSIDIMEEECF